ncbi:MAG: DegT/DnrJ/EryC1/StrS aminotransferase family protein [Dehalococcoidales bacterium]
MEFRDLKAQYQKLKNEIDEAVLGVMERAQFISGPEVKQLEGELAEYVGVKHCITCANGTDAMELVLLAWGICEGDAVFVPTFSFMSTAEVVAYLGAQPVYVDIDEDTYNIDPAKLYQTIEQTIKGGKFKPKAIIPVDLFGLPSDYERIIPIAEKYGLKVLEDGAQGFGGSINGKKACSFGDAATTSFFPAKPLGCYGDGGAIFTNDDELASLIRSFAVHGKGQGKYDNVRIGRNSRLDTIQAAVLLVKLKAFREYELDAVNKVAAKYTAQLKSLVETPIVPESYYSSWAQYTIRLGNEEKRDNLQAKLKEAGIPSMVYYPRPLHLQTAFSYCGHKEGDFPVAENASKCALSLPMFTNYADITINRICSEVKKNL